MKSLAASFLLFLLALTVFDAGFRVDPGQLAVVSSPITGTRNNIGPGIHLKWPLLDRVQRVPLRVLLQPELRYSSRDGRELVQSPWVLARVSDAARYANASGTNPGVPRDRLATALQSSAVPALREQTFAQTLADRGQTVWANTAVADAAAREVGLVIEDRGVASVGMPADSASAKTIQSGMRAIQDEVVARARVDAQAQLKAATAQTDSERIELLATARKSADARRAEGDLEAARIYAEVAAEDPSAAAFDRAAMAYRRARLAGKPVSLDDPAFQALRYQH
ncbi:SPFH domain-containing protein [Solilutibacter silvestris]|uniref:SPFH domain-containing protein n=1 Tax=Solilutibacter silvestris TaxID=1645665 RepID=UPI003D33F0E4